MLDFCNVKSHHLQLKTIIIMLIRNSTKTTASKNSFFLFYHSYMYQVSVYLKTEVSCFIFKFTCITSHVYSHHYTSSLENATTNGSPLIHRRFGSVVNYISFIVIHVVNYIVLGLFLPNSSTGCVCSILKY